MNLRVAGLTAGDASRNARMRNNPLAWERSKRGCARRVPGVAATALISLPTTLLEETRSQIFLAVEEVGVEALLKCVR